MYTKAVDSDTDITPVVTLSFTRPANTTAYGANDAVGIDATIQQVETATAAGNVSTSGDASVIVTAAGMTGSPRTVSVALLDTDDDGTAIGEKIRAALAADAIVSAFFTVSGATDQIILTAITGAANDATMNIAIADDTCVGVTAAPTSADTTAGAATGGAGSAIQTIATGLPAGSTLEFTDTTLRIDLSAVTASMTTFFLHLYSASPTAILDNATWDLVSADRSSYLGYLALGTPVDMGSTLFVQVANIGKRVVLASGTSNLYGVLVTTGGYTPTSAESFSITMHLERK